MGRMKLIKDSSRQTIRYCFSHEGYDSVYVEADGPNYDEFYVHSNDRIKEFIVCLQTKKTKKVESQIVLQSLTRRIFKGNQYSGSASTSFN